MSGPRSASRGAPTADRPVPAPATPALPTGVDIVEVAPRDGLQDEPRIVPTTDKVELIGRLVGAGATRIEAVSFAHPDRVPQMADAEAVLEAIGRPPGVEISALVLNERGVDRAISAGVKAIAVVVIVTDGFSQENQGFPTDRALAMWHAVGERAHDAGIATTLTLAAAFGCPVEGVVLPDRVRQVAERAMSTAPTELCLADTIGAAVPSEVGALVAALGNETGRPIRIHLHNSRNTGYANALAAVAAGARAVDASLGGIGGCPFAPGASGNVATEDLVHLFEREGIATGLDIDHLLDDAAWLAEVLGHDLPGQVAKAGPFPPRP